MYININDFRWRFSHHNTFLFDILYAIRLNWILQDDLSFHMEAYMLLCIHILHVFCVLQGNGVYVYQSLQCLVYNYKRHVHERLEHWVVRYVYLFTCTVITAQVNK